MPSRNLRVASIARHTPRPMTRAQYRRRLARMRMRPRCYRLRMGP